MVPGFSMTNFTQDYKVQDHSGNSPSEPREGLKHYVENHEILKKLHEGGDCPYQLFFVADPDHNLFMEASDSMYHSHLADMEQEQFDNIKLEESLTDQELE